MDGISVASGVAGLITLALQVSGTVAAYVTAIRDKSKNIKELHDELLLLGEVLSQLQDFLASEKAKERPFDKGSVLSKAISSCKIRIERIGDKLKPTDGGKVARALDRLKWPFEQQDVNRMIDNLRRYSNTFQFAVTIEGCAILSKTSDDATKSLKEMLEMSKKVSQMSAQLGLSTEAAQKQGAQLEQIIVMIPMLSHTADEVREMSSALKIAEIREQERRTTEILDWLAPISTLHKHRDVQARRAAGTGGWFLEHDHFRKWSEDIDSHQDMLCIGGPGVGKSVLCSLVVDELRQRHQSQEVAVVHYYCSYSEQQSQTPVHLARAILRQLCAFRRTIPTTVAEFYQKTRNDVKDQTWFQELRNVLRHVISTYNKCYVVVDAFDETDALQHRAGLFEVLNTIRSVPTTTKIFATTRPHLSKIEDSFYQPLKILVSADPKDLRHYLAQRISQHPDSDHVFDDVLKEEILNKLCENANGMFLLPSLHIQNILDQVTKSDVRRTLKNLSSDLTTAFSSTIERIRGLSDSRKSIAFKTLMWISHSRRPLTVEELQHALALRYEDNDIDRDNFLSLRTILDSCCGLVQHDQESNIIRLVHFSLEEYLKSQNHDLFENGHMQVTQTCLKYISLDSVMALHDLSRTAFEKHMNELPFIEYACHEWGHHAKNVEIDLISNSAMNLLTNSNQLFVAARVREIRSHDFRKFRERMLNWSRSSGNGGGISLAASFGLTDLVRLLISRAQKPNLVARNLYGSTPLHEVAIFGHEDTAELLIAHGADLLDRNLGQATPFFLAISYGHLRMAQTLLKYDRRQLESMCKGGYGPLHKAVELGVVPMVEFMLQEGALVGAHDLRGWTPLHIAAIRGYTEISRMLVVAGAAVHVMANDGMYPLDFAATAGHRDIVELLADNGGSISYKGYDNWRPLERAARGGHLDTVVLLLERGADVFNQDRKGNTALHLAVRSGNLELVRQILEYEPSLMQRQLSSMDVKGSTPRVVAFFTARYDIHKYLRAAEWSVAGNEPTTANKLNTAIEEGDILVVQQIVLDNPTALETLDEDGQPPLHVAIQESKLEIASYLLQRGAPIEQSGYHGWRALHIAASLGSLPLVKLCLSHNATVSSRTDSQQTPLHKACSSISLPVIRHLIASGADINAKNDRGMTILHVAAHANNFDMVRMLVLDYDMDANTRDRFGDTPAEWAQRSAHLEIAAFLKTAERQNKRPSVVQALGEPKDRENLGTSSRGLATPPLTKTQERNRERRQRNDKNRTPRKPLESRVDSYDYVNDHYDDDENMIQHEETTKSEPEIISTSSTIYNDNPMPDHRTRSPDGPWENKMMRDMDIRMGLDRESTSTTLVAETSSTTTTLTANDGSRGRRENNEKVIQRSNMNTAKSLSPLPREVRELLPEELPA